MIISDGDTRFQSNFRQSLQKRLGTRLNLSTSFHPQKDGQSERALGTWQEMIRPYVDILQFDCDKHLDAIEFAYNNSVNASTGLTLFYVQAGQHPHTVHDALARPDFVKEVSNDSAQSLLDEIAEVTKISQAAIDHANKQMVLHANKKRIDIRFTVGDEVWLSTKTFNLSPGTH